jgi:CheY-like chemotaxis protein/two-component sensor histidine kinase
MLAHELRNPLAPIRHGVQMLALSPGDPDVAAKARDVIDRQSAQMTRLVDELLDASRIARGKVTLRRERLDLAALARAVAEDHRAGLEAAGLTVAVEAAAAPPVWVDGDAARVTQILGNLLHNAQKFTDAGGRVTVRVRREGGVAALSVEDTGIGIDPAALPRLFEEFSQVDATIERSKGGLGLGLAVVRGLAGLHGGAVEAASAGPGKGAAFTVRLPLAGDEAAGEAAPVPQQAAHRVPGQARRRVLVVEDGEDAAESLRTLLGLRGFDVAVARSGPEGVEAAGRLRPDAVVCDLGLPGMSGFEVARALRADPATASTLLICLSGYAQEEDRRKAREAGFDAHLAKGGDAGELFRALDAGRADADAGGTP